VIYSRSGDHETAINSFFRRLMYNKFQIGLKKSTFNRDRPPKDFIIGKGAHTHTLAHTPGCV